MLTAMKRVAVAENRQEAVHFKGEGFHSGSTTNTANSGSVIGKA